MKRNFLILSIICLLTLLVSSTVSAQTYNTIEKKITLVKGKKKIIKSEVRDSDEIRYEFKAGSGTSLTVKVIGKDADFSLWVVSSFDTYTLAEDKKSWSGKLVPNETKYAIVVHSNYKVADFQLEITLK